MSNDIDNFNNNIELFQRRDQAYHFFMAFEKKYRDKDVKYCLSIELRAMPKKLHNTKNISCLFTHNSIRVYSKYSNFRNFIFDMYHPSWLPTIMTKFEMDWLIEFFKKNSMLFELITE